MTRPFPKPSIFAMICAFALATPPVSVHIATQARIYLLLGLALFLLGFAEDRAKGRGTALTAWRRFVFIFLGTSLALFLGAKCLMLGKDFLAALQADFFSSLIDGREALKVWLLSHGRSMYPDMSASPYIVTLYTPLFHALSALGALITGNVIFSCHLINYAAFLGLYLTCAFWIRFETEARYPAFVLPGLMLISAYFGDYGLAIRPDPTAWFFAYASLCVFHLDRNEKRALYLSMGLVAAAMLTKQQTLPVFLACALSFSIGERPWRFCLKYALGVAVIGLASFILLQTLTGGDFINHSVIYPARLASMPSVTNFDNAIPRFISFFKTYPALMLIYAGFLAAAIMRRRLHMLDWVVIWQIPFLIKLVSTWGADNNYFLGLLIAVFLRTGVGFGELWRRGKAGRAAFITAGFLLVATMPSLYQAATYVSPFVADEASRAALRRAASQGDVLINAEGAPIILPDNHEDRLFFFDGTETGYYEKAGMWNFAGSKLASDIADKRFSAIILRLTFFDPQLLRLVQTYYKPAETYGRYTVYAPRPGLFAPMPFLPVKSGARGKIRIDALEPTGVDFQESFGAFCASKNENAEAGRMTLRVTAPLVAKTVTLLFFPKVVHASPDDGIDVLWSPDGSHFESAARYAGDGKDTDRGLFEPRIEAKFSPKAKTFYLQFVLRGSAQLWSNATNPMMLVFPE